MSEIIRNRTIRPSTRKAASKSYKIDTRKVAAGDVLTVNIKHESKPSLLKIFQFDGIDIANKDSIHFQVTEHGDSLYISWSGAVPKVIT